MGWYFFGGKSIPNMRIDRIIDVCVWPWVRVFVCASLYVLFYNLYCYCRVVIVSSVTLSLSSFFCFPLFCHHCCHCHLPLSAFYHHHGHYCFVITVVTFVIITIVTFVIIVMVILSSSSSLSFSHHPSHFVIIVVNINVFYRFGHSAPRRCCLKIIDEEEEEWVEKSPPRNPPCARWSINFIPPIPSKTRRGERKRR